MIKMKEEKLKKALIGVFTAVIMLASVFIPEGIPVIGVSAAHAATGYVSVESVGDMSGIQGDKWVIVAYSILNGRSENVVVDNMTLSIDGGDIDIEANNGSITIPAGESQTVTFKVSIGKRASEGSRSCNFSGNLKTTGGAELTNQRTVGDTNTFRVYEKTATDSREMKAVPAVEITHSISPSAGFTEGNDNVLKLELFNYGNSTLKNSVVAVTLPDGLSIYNGSNQVQLGYFSVGKRVNVEFPVTVKADIESRNYPIEVEVRGVSYSSEDSFIKKTFYIPVEGSGTSSGKYLNIANVSVPDEVAEGENFNMNFRIQNTGSASMKNVKVTVEPAEGIVNKSRNVFIDNFKAGESKNYSVKLYAFEGADEKSYPIKITAAPVGSSDKENEGAMQYASVTVSGSGNGVKKPQLMVESYNYGGNAVQAGSVFFLNLSVLNTSEKSIKNIKVSLSNEEGVFVPASGSNSFFIDKLKGRESYSKTIKLNVKPKAEEATSAVKVDFTYEDGKGEAFEASDVISIPVTQMTRLVVDDLVPPAEIYAGQQSSCELQFYNMGKSVLNNLRVNCEGDFDVAQSNSYFVGNMESGKSDSYTFNFIPREAGTMSGVITFTFEDSEGELQFMEVPFEFEVMEEEIFDEDDMDFDEEKKPIPWALITAGIVCLAGITGLVIYKRRKKKLHNSLLIDESFDMDIKDEPSEDSQNEDRN
ncbi:MAG: COG1361 S-layer family protein [Anaerovoracaceae bacterium]